MTKLKAIILLALIGLVGIFAVQNAATVEIDFLTWTFNMPRALLVILLLSVGFVLGLISASLSAFKKKR